MLVCFFPPGLISRDQETDGQTGPLGTSPATVVSREDLLKKLCLLCFADGQEKLFTPEESI